MAKDSFVFYTQWAEQINLLTDKQAGALFKAVCGYVETGKIKKLDAVTNMLFSVIKSQIDKDTAKYEETCQKRKQAGAKGGRPKAEKQKVFTESKKSKRFFEKAKKADNDNVNDNVNDNGTYTNSPINSPISNECIKKSEEKKRAKFTPPTYDEVEKYAISRGRKDLAKTFYDYYSEGGWKDRDGNSIKSWKQKFITWESKNPVKDERNGLCESTFDTDEFFQAALKRSEREMRERWGKNETMS